MKNRLSDLVIVSMYTAILMLLALSPSNSYGGPIYALNNAIGSGGVTGTIETNGTIGTLISTNILDWNLVIDDGSNTFNLLGPLSGNNSLLFMSGGTPSRNWQREPIPSGRMRADFSPCSGRT